LETGRRLSAEQENAADFYLLDNHAEWLEPIMSIKIEDEEMYPIFVFAVLLVSSLYQSGGAW